MGRSYADPQPDLMLKMWLSPRATRCDSGKPCADDQPNKMDKTGDFQLWLDVACFSLFYEKMERNE